MCTEPLLEVGETSITGVYPTEAEVVAKVPEQQRIRDFRGPSWNSRQRDGAPAL